MAEEGTGLIAFRKSTFLQRFFWSERMLKKVCEAAEAAEAAEVVLHLLHRLVYFVVVADERSRSRNAIIIIIFVFFIDIKTLLHLLLTLASKQASKKTKMKTLTKAPFHKCATKCGLASLNITRTVFKHTYPV